MDANFTEVIWIVDQQNPSNDKTTHQVITQTVERNISPQAYKPTRNKESNQLAWSPRTQTMPQCRYNYILIILVGIDPRSR